MFLFQISKNYDDYCFSGMHIFVFNQKTFLKSKGLKNKIKTLSKFEMTPQIATEKVKFTGPEKLTGFKSRFPRLSSKRKENSSNFIFSLDTS